MMKINTRADAQAGLKGSVVIAPQRRIQGQGAPTPGLMMSQNRIGDVGQAINDDETPTWGQVRSLFTCDRFGGHVSGFPGWFEDCVQERPTTGAASALGVIPYFFGWTFHPPNATDVVITDPITTGTIELYSTLVPEATDTITQVSYGLTTFSPIINVFTDGPAGFNVGLYRVSAGDANVLELLTETGLIPVLDGGADQITGFFATPLLTSVTLDAGEYFQAFATNCCMRMYTIADSAAVTSTIEADASPAFPLLNPGKHFGKAWIPASTFPATTSELVNAMYSTIDRTQLRPLSGINVPMVMYG